MNRAVRPSARLQDGLSCSRWGRYNKPLVTRNGLRVPRMEPSPYPHVIAKVSAQLPAAVTPTPMSSLDASWFQPITSRENCGRK
jgi:hypothetical protein